MTNLQLSEFYDGDAWLILRLDAQVQNQWVDVYMMMDLPNGALLAFQTIDTDMAGQHQVKALLDDSHAKKPQWPKRLILANGDPAEDIIRTAAQTHDILLECVPSGRLEDIVKPVKASYGQHFFSPSSMVYSAMSDSVDEMDFESAKLMIPDAYDPCWCASGKKFKFCCKPIFRQILDAMTHAEEHRKDEALKSIEEAKRIVGENAEVLCREAIVWACFDRTKSATILDRAISKNPLHPRANYILGIDCKERGDFAGAIAAYNRAIENYPKTDRFHLNEAYNNLGTAYFESGDAKNAKVAWEQALILMPSDKIVRRNLIEFIYQNSKLTAAERVVSPFVAKFIEKF